MTEWILQGIQEAGRAEIGEGRFRVIKLYLKDGEVKFAIRLPPSNDTYRGRLRIYGPDGRLVVEGRTYIVPPHQDLVQFDYGLAPSVTTPDYVTDLSQIARNWR